MPIQSVYSATKAYVTSLTESLWFSGRAKGVRVVNLCPGITATNFNQRAGGKPEDLPKLLTQSPEEVVHEALRQLDSGCGPTRVTGGFNRLGVFMTRLLPRKWVVVMMGKSRQ
jgi:short-subunit dehydrogenase